MYSSGPLKGVAYILKLYNDHSSNYLGESLIDALPWIVVSLAT
jgi:hypothetical protein